MTLRTLEIFLTASLVAKSEWFKHWAGGWSLLSCSCFGEQYTRTIEAELGVRLHTALFFCKNGRSFCMLDAGDMAKFGGALAAKVVKEKTLAKTWCEQLCLRTDAILSLIERLEKKVEGSRALPSKKEFEAFLDAFYAYVVPHIAIKKSVDFLPPAVLEKVLQEFTAARKCSEPVYDKSEEFVRSFAGRVAVYSKIPVELILSCTKQEFLAHLDGTPLPSKAVLQARFDGACLAFSNGDFELHTGAKAIALEDAACKPQEGLSLKGKVAFAGKATGAARIVLDAANPGVFNDGDVLVAGMTRPEFLPLMKKACAVVTDGGGVLCHAAIMARELKKPCVIGTLKATKTFHNGDLLVVDAEKGVVSKARKR